MAERPAVLLLIPHLSGGGAEQVTALLAVGLSHKKYRLHLGLITQSVLGIQTFPAHVEVHMLGARRVRSSALRLLRLVRRLKPDLILTNMAHLNFLVLLLRPFFPPSTRVLVRQNGTVSANLASRNLPGYTRLLYHLLYPRADRVICQTHAMARDLSTELSMRQERLAVLPNPVNVEAIRASERNPPNPWSEFGLSPAGPHLLAVGRLAHEKGFDLLLRALVIVRRRFPHTNLIIAGTGPEEAALKVLCSELGLEGAVHYAGYVDHPCSYFPGASVFVLPSRHEGLPNALLEAAAGGLPLVALPASQGVVDLLSGQFGVWLAAEATAEALTTALLAAIGTLNPGQRFPHPFIQQFSVERAIRAYEDLIDSSLRDHPR
ncbi:MAG: glycosyltransferase [Terracidiphilus sp.]|jgi:glycosyltransferase involved in cell wall biosynthesis